MNTPPALAALLLGLILTITGCGGGASGTSAGEVAVRWRTAEANGDFGTSWDLEAPEWRGNQPKAENVAADQEIRRNKPPIPPGEKFAKVEATRTVKDDTREEDFVFVYLRITNKQSDINDQVVTLRRVEGAWRVAKWEP